MDPQEASVSEVHQSLPVNRPGRCAKCGELSQYLSDVSQRPFRSQFTVWQRDISLMRVVLPGQLSQETRIAWHAAASNGNATLDCCLNCLNTGPSFVECPEHWPSLSCDPGHAKRRMATSYFMVFLSWEDIWVLKELLPIYEHYDWISRKIKKFLKSLVGSRKDQRTPPLLVSPWHLVCRED